MGDKEIQDRVLQWFSHKKGKEMLVSQSAISNFLANHNIKSPSLKEEPPDAEMKEDDLKEETKNGSNSSSPQHNEENNKPSGSDETLQEDHE